MRNTLDKTLRSQLERTVVKARDIAELAAREELQRLAVGDKSPADYLTEQQRNLRRSLRAHGRQLGDYRKPEGAKNAGEQGIEHLVTEVAYEHWHRMLFARFLAENNLLMYKDGVTALAIQDCFDLAEEETGDSFNGWHYAANYAARMLPQIFRIDSPVFAINLAPNHQKQLEQLLSNLAQETFQASDSLGWVYQFWQAKRKEQINKSEVKIGADELSAVTQLFTEPYMVSFLLDNSLGAWWVTNHPKIECPIELTYLRTLEDGTPAAGRFEGWPKQIKDLKTLDPCCGSGHFLVAAFLMLVPMRMAVEGLPAPEAVDAVLSDNIHGLELDQRCVELAAFALALEAWRYPDAGGYRALPELHIACSGLGINTKKEEWLALAGDNSKLYQALDSLYTQFKNAPILGSLINPDVSLGKESLFESKWEDVGPLLTNALAGERSSEKDEIGVVAKGIAKAANLMADEYQLVMTNVPYLGREGHTQELRDFADMHLSKASGDLAVLMLERIFSYVGNSGDCFLVLPQNWWVGRTYSDYREDIIRKRRWLLAVVLGEEAWETFGNRGPNTVLVGISSRPPSVGNRFSAIDLSSKPNRPIVTRKEKTVGLKKEIHDGLGKVFLVSQEDQLNNPDMRISLHPLTTSKLLNQYVISGEGSSTGDADHFLKYHWEVKWGGSWIAYISPDGKSSPWSGRELLMLWEDGSGELAKSSQARIQNLDLWKKKGILVGRVRGISTTLFDGGAYSKGAVLICPKREGDLGKIYNFLKSTQYEDQVRALDPRVSASTSVLTKVGFDYDLASQYEYQVPIKYSRNLTQWIFHGHPAQSEEPFHVAIARLLGYQWKTELDPDLDLANEQREWVEQCKTLSSYVDDDGIVCLSAVRGEKPAHERLEELLQAAYGSEWSTNVRNKLLEQVGCKNKSLELWLRENFFEQHCKLFQQRPFIWQLWDGLKDGFSVLVNYQKLDKKNLERLIYTYLDDWIRSQKLQQAEGIDGSTERLAAAEGLKQRLELILEGEAPYDIFVRWKPLEQQPIGWSPDLNDGVRLNIRPFMTVTDVGQKGAGILRAKPNIKWTKDRGKDVESAPWYDTFNGDRINEHHLTLAEKNLTREN